MRQTMNRLFMSHYVPEIFYKHKLFLQHLIQNIMICSNDIIYSVERGWKGKLYRRVMRFFFCCIFGKEISTKNAENNVKLFVCNSIKSLKHLMLNKAARNNFKNVAGLKQGSTHPSSAIEFTSRLPIITQNPEA